MPKYDHKKIEAKWQKRWEKERIFKVDDKAPPSKKRYVLDMFPYPSGAGLHVGHPEGYTATDIYCRYLRMQGYQVLHPMGWDAFGLPAENYAIKSGIHPKESTEQNIKTFKRQIKSLGFSYDWSREVNTASVDYYKWTQWLFLQFYKHGLAYKKAAPVNWCDDCQTVLANEQVVDGKCERCGNKVAQKNLEQWFLKITGSDPAGKNGSYPERLLSNLEKLDWPAPIKTMQRNWIGRSEGAELEFPIVIARSGATKQSYSRVEQDSTENNLNRDNKIASLPAVARNDINFVLLHGYTGSPQGLFFPWLKGKLNNLGYEFVAPDLPNTEQPSEEEQVSYVLDNIKFDENTILFGHSLGAVVAMKVVEKLKNRIAGLVLAGGFSSPKFKDKDRPFHNTFKWEFNFEKIKAAVGFIKILSDKNDYAVHLEQGRYLHDNLGGELIEIIGQEPHFTGEHEPEILRACLPSIRVFTTRPDTLYGATYMVLAPEHTLIDELRTKIANWSEVEKYVKKAASKTQLERTDLAKEKTGVELVGVKAVNPANGEEIPVWIADYVLMGYGTGAIMAVPAHDERDFEFAKKFNLPIKQVITGGELPYIDNGKMVNSGEFDGTDSEEAKWKIAAKVGGKKTVQYKLRDWLISRQRYWGAPIPIIYCDKCAHLRHPPSPRLRGTEGYGGQGEQAAPEKDLPVELPNDVDFRPHGESPLARSKSFHQVKCPRCGSPARRESDTMDTFVDSSWYFLRYIDPKNDKEFASKDKIKAWLPVDTYVGGAEHAVMHLMYARFFAMVLHDLGHLDFEEPFLQLHNQGLILGPDGQKMSKSRGNVINPDDVIAQLGADTMRLYEMFMGPLEDAKPWDTNGIIGVRRFLDRVWNLQDLQKSPPARPVRRSLGEGGGGVRGGGREGEIEQELHKLIKKVGDDIVSFNFNTAVSQFMIFVNVVHKTGEISREHLEMFLRVLSPFAPHLANEIWEKLGHKELIERESWPAYDEQLLKSDSTTYVVQVNGKTRGTIIVPAGSGEGAVVKAAQEDERAARHLDGKQIVKQIFVKGKLVNFVAK